MKVKFDSLNRLEIPALYLCNPGCIYNPDGTLSNTLGCLSNTTDEELVLNFNTTSELNFRINLVHREDELEDEYITTLYRSVKNRRLIFVEDVGFFVIRDMTDGYEEGIYYKDVRADSCEFEISNILVPNIEEGTYKFDDLLTELVQKLPLWKVAKVDGDVKEMYRTFEEVATDKNILAFMLEDMQDAYECLFEFDTIKREITVYDQNDFVKQTKIHITRDDVMKSLDIVENSDDLYTAISVEGGSDSSGTPLGIRPANPLGKSTIYDFTYYLSWMSPPLSTKVSEWQSRVKNVQNQYYNLNIEYYSNLSKSYESEAEIGRLMTQLDMYEKCHIDIVARGADELNDVNAEINVIKNKINAIKAGNNIQLSPGENLEVLEASLKKLEERKKELEEERDSTVDSYNDIILKNGGTPVGIQNELADTIKALETQIQNVKDKISSEQSKKNGVDSIIAELSTKITNIVDSVDILNYFSSSEYEELSNYIFEGEYTDEYIIVTDNMTTEEEMAQIKLLYDRAINRLSKISEPTQEFTIDVENFLFEKEFSAWSDELRTGYLINVEVEYGDIAALFLSNITVNYDDKKMTLTFGSRFNRFDPQAMFKNILGDVKKTANSIEYMKDVNAPVKNGEFNALRQAIEATYILTKDMALSATNLDMVVDDTGILGRHFLNNGEIDPKQMKITNRTIVFTDDGWDTAKTALGNFLFKNPFNGQVESRYGVVADTIVGSIILSENVGIYNADTSITMDNDGLVLTANYTDPNKPVDPEFFCVQKRHKNAQGNEVYSKLMYIDTEGNLIINGSVRINTGDHPRSIVDYIDNEITNSEAETKKEYESAISKEHENVLDDVGRHFVHKADLGIYVDIYGPEGIVIGSNGGTTTEGIKIDKSPFKTVIDNKGIWFKQVNTDTGDEKIVSYVANDLLYIPDAVVEKSLSFGLSDHGHFYFAPHIDKDGKMDGGVSLMWSNVSISSIKG